MQFTHTKHRSNLDFWYVPSLLLFTMLLHELTPLNYCSVCLETGATLLRGSSQARRNVRVGFTGPSGRGDRVPASLIPLIAPRPRAPAAAAPDHQVIIIIIIIIIKLQGELWRGRPTMPSHRHLSVPPPPHATLEPSDSRFLYGRIPTSAGATVLLKPPGH